MKYLPKQGDIISVEIPVLHNAATTCDAPPRAGINTGRGTMSPGITMPHDMTPPHRRSTVVVSNDSYSRYTHLAVVLPIDESADPFPMHVPLDHRTQSAGIVLCEQLQIVELDSQSAKFVEMLPPDLLRDIMERVLLIFE